MVQQPRRWRRRARIISGWVLIVIGTCGLLAHPDTGVEHPKRCGGMNLVVAVHPSSAGVTGELQDRCASDARGTIAAGLFAFVLPGVVLLTWPRLRRRFPQLGGIGDTLTGRPRRSFGPQLDRAATGRAPGVHATELVFDSPHPGPVMGDRLLRFGNGGPVGSLRVDVAPDQTVRARILGEQTTMFFGRIVDSGSGSELRGYVRASYTAMVPEYVGFALAAALAVTAAFKWVDATTSGKVSTAALGFAAGAVFLGLAMVGMRTLRRGAQPAAVNGIAGMLANHT